MQLEHAKSEIDVQFAESERLNGLVQDQMDKIKNLRESGKIFQDELTSRLSDQNELFDRVP